MDSPLPEDLAITLRTEFRGLRTDLDGARARLCQKDTASARAEVARVRAKLDALLDMYLEMGFAGPPPERIPV